MKQATDIVSNHQEICFNIEKARACSPISAKTTIFLAASKSQPAYIIEEAISLGINSFGENRVQEAQEKWPDIKAKHPEIKLHLIGQLQTNKAKQALMLFDTIQTIDRIELAQYIVKLLGSEQNTRTKQFFIQVNTGKEPQKTGVHPQNADAFIKECKELGLPVAGLMCVPPFDQPAAPHFALLREIARRNAITELSMGMSDDYETAIRMGSSCVRIGTALFGERRPDGQ